MTRQTPAQDFQHHVQTLHVSGPIHHRKGTEAEGLGDVASVVAMGAAALDGDDRGRFGEAGEKFKEAGTAFGKLKIVAWFGVEGETQVDDGDVYLSAADDF
jgi:hypothetical protein